MQPDQPLVTLATISPEGAKLVVIYERSHYCVVVEHLGKRKERKFVALFRPTWGMDADDVKQVFITADRLKDEIEDEGGAVN